MFKYVHSERADQAIGALTQDLLPHRSLVPAERSFNGLESEETSLQRAQKELFEARSLCFDLYDLARIGLVTLCPRGVALAVNLAFAGLLGLTRSQLVGQRLTRFIESSDQDRFYRAFRHFWRDRARETLELHLRKADGTLLLAAVELHAMRVNEGECRLTISDITQGPPLRGAAGGVSEARRSETKLVRLADAARDLAAAEVGCSARPVEAQPGASPVAPERGRVCDSAQTALPDAPVLERKLLKSGEILFREGDLPTQLYQVHSGWIKLSLASLSGRDTITELLFPGDYFDVLGTLDGGQSLFTASSLCMHPAEVDGLAKAELKKDPRLLQAVKLQFLARMRRQQQLPATLPANRVEERILPALALIAERSGQRGAGLVGIPAPLTRQEFAELIGTSTETLIRTLADMRRRGRQTFSTHEMVAT